MPRRRREGAAGLEDGTAHFLGIAALRHGFAAIRRAGGFGAIDTHTTALARYEVFRLTTKCTHAFLCVLPLYLLCYTLQIDCLAHFEGSAAAVAAERGAMGCSCDLHSALRCRHAAQQLTSLRHFNGRPVVEVYTPEGVAAAAVAQAAESAENAAAMPPRPPSSSSSGGGSRDSEASSLSSNCTAVNSRADGASGAAGSESEAGDSGARDSAGGGAGSRYGIAGQGPVVTFNLRRSDGSWVGYRWDFAFEMCK